MCSTHTSNQIHQNTHNPSQVSKQPHNFAHIKKFIILGNAKKF